MPTAISGARQARSFVTPTGGAIASRVIDFNFASDQGIEISAVLGMVQAVDSSPTPSDTAPVAIQVASTLHQEEGTIEDVPFADGEDADQIDTEVFFELTASGMFQTGTTNTFGAGGNSAQAVLYLPYVRPILVARNITHRGETGATGVNGRCSILIFYHYVRFSLQEQGLILARRQ